MTSRRARPAWALAAAVLISGCAERDLLTAPSSDPGAGTWLAVGMGALVAALVWGGLLTLPVWRGRPSAPLAAGVLAGTAGGVVVAAAVLAGVAVRSWQLLDREASAAPEHALLRLSGSDGDTGFYALMVLTVVALAGLVVTLLALAARWAAGDDPAGRVVACIVLGVQVLVGVGSAVMLALGSEAWPYVVLAASAPLAAAALRTCWPAPRSVAAAT